MSNNSLISVLIPAYNHEKYVQEAITSIINQTYKNLELIVIDDGSKDRTWDKIKELEPECKERFANVMFIHKDNAGVVSSLNLGLQKVAGEFIYFIASDDVAKPKAITTLYNFAKNNTGYGMVVGDDEIIDGEGEIIYWDKHRRTVPINEAVYKTFAEFLQAGRTDFDFNSDDFGSYDTLLKGNYIPNGFIIKSSLLRNIGGWKIGVLEDWYMNLQLSKITKIKYLDNILFSYRWHDTNTIKQQDKMSVVSMKTLKNEADYVNNCVPDLLPLFHKQLEDMNLKRKIKICGITLLKVKYFLDKTEYYFLGRLIWKNHSSILNKK